MKIRNSIKVLLFNKKKQILLLCYDDPKTTSIDKKYLGRFWSPIGGEINSNESLEEAALREIFEETGLNKKHIKLGPIVWYGSFDLILHGILTHINQSFIVAKTDNTKVHLDNLDQFEKKIVKKISWFSLEDINKSREIIFPIEIGKYLPDIIAEKYPKKPIKIDLKKQP